MFLYLYSPRGLMNIRTIGHQSRAIQGHSLGGSHSNWAGHKTFTDSCQLKKTLKVESYVLFGGTSSPGDSISNDPEKVRVGEEPGYIEVLQQMQVV